MAKFSENGNGIYMRNLALGSQSVYYYYYYWTVTKTHGQIFIYANEQVQQYQKCMCRIQLL